MAKKKNIKTDKQKDISKPQYTTGNVCEVLGIDRERLRAWQLKGYVKPTKEAKGRGDRALFTKEDIYGIALFKLLLERGMKREVVSEIIGKFIGTEGNTFLNSLSYIMYGMIDNGKELKPFANMITHGLGDEVNLKMTYEMLATNMVLPGNKVTTHDHPVFDAKKGIWEDIHIINVRKLTWEIFSKLEEIK